jgi:hypothetical protein
MSSGMTRVHMATGDGSCVPSQLRGHVTPGIESREYSPFEKTPMCSRCRLVFLQVKDDDDAALSYHSMLLVMIC